MIASELKLTALQNSAEQAQEQGVCSGCSACSLRCASDVPAREVEWRRIEAYINGLEPDERERLTGVLRQQKAYPLGDDFSVQLCPFLDMPTHSCSIYPVRPLMCRLMGHVAWMPCPIGLVTHPLPSEQVGELLREYSSEARRTLASWIAESELNATGSLHGSDPSGA